MPSEGDPDDGDDSAAFASRTATATWDAPTDLWGATRKRRALFYWTPGGWVLEHVRETVVGQFPETTSDLDADRTATDVPTWVVRKAGLTREDLATTPGTPTTRPVATDGGTAGDPMADSDPMADDHAGDPDRGDDLDGNTDEGGS